MLAFFDGLVAQLVRASDSKQLGHLPGGCRLESHHGLFCKTERQCHPPTHGVSGTGLALIIYQWTFVTWVPH